MLGVFPLIALMSPLDRVMAGLHEQLMAPAVYDATYRRIAYPGGDVAFERGACTDVVVRSFRRAGYDLQALVHEDRLQRGMATDTNIDHRRVKGLALYFSHRWATLPLAAVAGGWKPGDVVCWVLDSGRDHTGVVSDRMGRSGLPLVVHNLSRTREEDVLAKWKIVGHYRCPLR